MIGLTALAIGLLWLAISVFFAIKLPKWFGASKPVWRGLLGGIVFVILMIGPFVDHIVGMRQFEKLCIEQTNVKISPNASNTKRGKQASPKTEQLKGYVIPIQRSTAAIVDIDSGEVIASYNHFSTKGGVVGGPLTAFGGEHVCDLSQPRHVEYKKFLQLLNQIKLVY